MRRRMMTRRTKRWQQGLTARSRASSSCLFRLSHRSARSCFMDASFSTLWAMVSDSGRVLSSRSPRAVRDVNLIHAKQKQSNTSIFCFKGWKRSYGTGPHSRYSWWCVLCGFYASLLHANITLSVRYALTQACYMCELKRKEKKIKILNHLIQFC